MMNINDIQISDSLIVDNIYTDSEDVIRGDSIDSEQVETEEILNLKKLEEEGLTMLIDSLPNLSVKEIANSINQSYIGIGIYGNIDAETLGRLDDYNLIRLILLFSALNHNEGTCVSEYFVLIREARRRGLRIPEINYELATNQEYLTNKK